MANVDRKDIPDPRDIDVDPSVAQLMKNFSFVGMIKIPKDKLDPNYAYRFISKNPRVFSRRKGVGWTPVKVDELESLVRDGYKVEDLVLGTHVTPDGYLALSDDLILAKMPKRQNQAIKAHQLKKNLERVTRSREQFHDARKFFKGVTTFEDVRE